MLQKALGIEELSTCLGPITEQIKPVASAEAFEELYHFHIMVMK
jgi:hypothetical protein